MAQLVEISNRADSLFVPFARIREIRPPEDGTTGAIAVTLNGDDREYSIDPDEFDALRNPETIVPAADGWWAFVAPPGIASDDAAVQPEGMERHPVIGWRVGGVWPEPILATAPDARRLLALVNLNENIAIDSFASVPEPFLDWWRSKLATRLERAGVKPAEFFGELRRIGEAEAAVAEAKAVA